MLRLALRAGRARLCVFRAFVNRHSTSADHLSRLRDRLESTRSCRSGTRMSRHKADVRAARCRQAVALAAGHHPVRESCAPANHTLDKER